MILLVLRDALWVTLLALPLMGFDLVQVYGVQERVLIWHWDQLGKVFIVVLVGRLLGTLFQKKRIGLRRSHYCGQGMTTLCSALQDRPLYRNLSLVILLVCAVLFPFMPFVSNTAVDVVTLALIYVMLGLGLNIVVGLAGLLDLGYVGFYAVGAYGYGLLYQYWGWSFWMALPVCGLLAALFGVALGFPVLRLRGDYLAIVTLGFGEIIRIILNNWDSFTNGPNGIMGIPRPTLFGLEFARQSRQGGTPFHEFFGIDYRSNAKLIFMYLIILLMVIVTMFVIHRLQNSRLGRAWVALREDEMACAAMGINTTLTKLSAFGLGACWAGFAGAFYGARQGFINPESFTFTESATILAIVVLGGMGSTMGVTVAALALVLIPELAREFAQYRMLIFAMVMITIVIWKPEGLLPARRRMYELRDQPGDDVPEVSRQ